MAREVPVKDNDFIHFSLISSTVASHGLGFMQTLLNDKACLTPLLHFFVIASHISTLP